MPACARCWCRRPSGRRRCRVTVAVPVRWAFATPAAGPQCALPELPRAEAGERHQDTLEHVARTLLRRYGVVCWRLLEREAAWLPPWRELLRMYQRLEARGEIRGGRFIAGLSGEQFALPDAIAALRRVCTGAAATVDLRECKRPQQSALQSAAWRAYRACAGQSCGVSGWAADGSVGSRPPPSGAGTHPEQAEQALRRLQRGPGAAWGNRRWNAGWLSRPAAQCLYHPCAEADATHSGCRQPTSAMAYPPRYGCRCVLSPVGWRVAAHRRLRSRAAQRPL